MGECYHNACDTATLNETVPFANILFLKKTTQAIINTVIDATDAKCHRSRREVSRFGDRLDSSYNYIDKRQVSLDSLPTNDNGEPIISKIINRKGILQTKLVSFDPIRQINRVARPELVLRPFFDGNVLIPRPQNEPVPRLQNVPNYPEEQVFPNPSLPNLPIYPDVQVQLQNLPNNPNPHILNEAFYPYNSLQNVPVYPNSQIQNVLNYPDSRIQSLPTNTYPQFLNEVGPLNQNLPQLQNNFIPQQQNVQVNHYLRNPDLQLQQATTYPFLQNPNPQFVPRLSQINENSIQDSFNQIPNVISNVPIQQTLQPGFQQSQIPENIFPSPPNNLQYFVPSITSDSNINQIFPFTNPPQNNLPHQADIPYSSINFPSSNQFDIPFPRVNTQNNFPNNPSFLNPSVQTFNLQNEIQNQVLFSHLNYLNDLTRLLQIQNYLNSNPNPFSGLPIPLLSLLIRQNYEKQLNFVNHFQQIALK